MAILTGKRIRELMAAGALRITPPPARFNPNSVNLTLDDRVLVYNVFGSPYCDGLAYDAQANPSGWVKHLDPRRRNPVRPLALGDGYVLKPGVLYVASTLQWTHAPDLVPVLEGRSSLGRLGLEAHVCAGYGETGFAGTWTLELRATHPTLVWAGLEVCQLSFQTVEGEVEEYAGRYQRQAGPTACRLHLDHGGEGGR